MIDTLQGKVISVTSDAITLDVSGFGVKVFSTGSLIRTVTIGDDLFCYTYLQVSAAGIAMFGFFSERERDLFQELVQVKTVGGKLAMTVLRHLDVEDVLKAITLGNTAALSVPGLGAKRTERICFELKTKIAKKFPDINISDNVTFNQSGFSLDKFVMDALTGLGFTLSESMRAVSLSKAADEDEIDWTEEKLLKASLSVLQRK